MSNTKRQSIVAPDLIIATRSSLTQTAAAEICGVSRATYQNYEYGVTAMPILTFNHFKAECEKLLG